MNKKIFVWIDLEMTGLDPEKDAILEIATIVTDGQLNILKEGPKFVVHQPDSVLDAMIPLVKELHGKSGLTEAVRTSTTTLKEAETETLNCIKEYAKQRNAHLAGNSVWQDRVFLQKYMPSITDYLHYRLVDVTSFKVAINAWYPKGESYEKNKQDKHRALSDIKESIAELAFYRKHFFVQ